MENWAGAEAAAKVAYGGSPASVLDAAGYGEMDLMTSLMLNGFGEPHKVLINLIITGVHLIHMIDHYVLSYQATFFNNDFVALIFRH